MPDSYCHSNITVDGFSRGIARAQEASDPGDDPGPGDGPVRRARLRLRHGRRRRARGRRLREDGVQLLPGQGGPRLQRGPSPPRRTHRRDPHPPARRLARGAVPPADGRAHRPRGARRGSEDRGDPAAGGRQHRPARAAVHRLGARGRGAHAGDRGGDGERARRPRPGRRRALAGVDEPARLPRGLQPADRGRGPARPRRRPARAGAPRLRPARVRACATTACAEGSRRASRLRRGCPSASRGSRAGRQRPRPA